MGQYGTVLLTVPLAYCQTQLEPHGPGKVIGRYCSPQALGRSSINTGIVWTSVSSGKLGWDNLAMTTSKLMPLISDTQIPGATCKASPYEPLAHDSFPCMSSCF